MRVGAPTPLSPRMDPRETGMVIWRALVVLWRVGLLRMSFVQAIRAALAWRRCGGSLAFVVELAALRFGEHHAIHDDDGPLNFVELRRAYEALAARLIAEFGAGPGLHVVVVGPNHRSTVIAIAAATRTGADVLLLNPSSPPAVLQRILSARTPDIVLHARDVDPKDFAAGARHLALPADPKIPTAGLPLPRLRRIGHLVILTSGSTGQPKRVSRRPTLRSLLPAAIGLLESLPIALHRPTVLAVPLVHGQGLATCAMAMACAAPLYLGRSHEIAPLLARVPSPADAIVVSVPTLIKRWMVTKPAPRSVGAVITGSAPLCPYLCRRVLAALGSVLYNLYGSSEAGVVSIASPSMLNAAPGTVGHPLPGNEVRIVDVNNQATPHGDRGAIHVRGPLVRQAGADGWSATGDCGRFDEGGRLHICGRTDAMFISGGDNVYPDTVELQLMEHPAIDEAAIVVVSDPDFGQRMRAFVVLSAGEHPAEGAIRLWLKDRVERFEMPRTIEVLDVLPRNAVGKIDRPALADRPERSLDASRT